MRNLSLFIVLLSVCNFGHAQTDKITENEVEDLKSRIEILEKKVELLDQMVAQNTELAKTNRTLNKQLGQLMKALHPKELEKMNP